MVQKTQTEKGQVLVIMVVGIVAVLAFAAIAIDGGTYYADRRFDQNVADDSSLAGAGAAGSTLKTQGVNYTNFSCADSDGDGLVGNDTVEAAIAIAEAEAQARATANNFGTLPVFTSQSALEASGHGVWVECMEEATYLGDKYLAVHVMVTNDVQPTFSHLFFGGMLRNTVEAISKVEVPEGAGRGLAIVALNQDGCGGNDGGLFFTGDQSVTIQDSGAHSNACLDCSGNASVYALDPDSGNPFPLTFIIPPKGATCSDIDPVPSTTTESIEPTYIDMSGRCNTTVSPDPAAVGGVINVTPGTYNRIRSNQSETVVFQPGLYCINTVIDIKGDAVVSTFTTDTSNPDYYEGITIYSNGADVTFNGGANIQLVAPKMLPGPPPSEPTTSVLAGAIPGLLLYVHPEAVVKLNGGSNLSYIRGTILNPDGEVTIAGNSVNDSWYVQVIADEIFVGGTASMNITYDGDDIYWGSSTMELHR